MVFFNKALQFCIVGQNLTTICLILNALSNETCETFAGRIHSYEPTRISCRGVRTGKRKGQKLGNNCQTSIGKFLVYSVATRIGIPCCLGCFKIRGEDYFLVSSKRDNHCYVSYLDGHANVFWSCCVIRSVSSKKSDAMDAWKNYGSESFKVFL